MDVGLILILIGSLILTVGDIVMKKWVAGGANSLYLYVLGVGIYLGGTLFLAESFKYKNIAVASVIFILVNVAILVVISWYYFKESLSLMQLVGIALGIASVVILELA